MTLPKGSPRSVTAAERANRASSDDLLPASRTPSRDRRHAAGTPARGARPTPATPPPWPRSTIASTGSGRTSPATSTTVMPPSSRGRLPRDLGRVLPRDLLCHDHGDAERGERSSTLVGGSAAPAPRPPRPLAGPPPGSAARRRTARRWQSPAAQEPRQRVEHLVAVVPVRRAIAGEGQQHDVTGRRLPHGGPYAR